jgi:hypothetical protein
MAHRPCQFGRTTPGAARMLGGSATIVDPAEIRHDVVVIRGETRCEVTKCAGDAVDPHPKSQDGQGF